jgi:uncharacterized protein
MPLNAHPEYYKAKAKFEQATTKEEKIATLEEMLSTAPTHKGADKLRAELKAKLAKIKKSATKKSARHMTTIPKEGDAQVSILGMTQSGKSTLLSKITNAKPLITNRPYTTTRPEIGSIEWKGVIIQTIEVPSTFRPIDMNIAQNGDGVAIVFRNEEEKQAILNIIKQFRIKKPIVEININDDPEKIKEDIWNILGLIKVYCKEPGKKPEKKALVLDIGTPVSEAAPKVHKDFLKFFKFARVWGTSVKFAGERVGLEHILKDNDILEIRIS